MTIAIYAGSFDPFTLGHLDVLKQACSIFEKVIITIGINPDKKSFIPLNDRIEMIKKATEGLNVEAKTCEGLIVDFAKENGATVLIRGLRNSVDFESERNLGVNNNKLNPEIKTVYFISSPEYSHISSSAVRELLSYNKDISHLVPKVICDYLS